MRISQKQKNDIIELVKQHISDTARIWLFGSRVNDNAKGGDIDLLLEVDNLQNTVARKSIILSI